MVPLVLALRLALLPTAAERLPPNVGRVHARMLAAPRTKGIESYQTVTVACSKCSELLFRYKKKNGLRSNLIKCYVERIVGDPHGLLAAREELRASAGGASGELCCPACGSGFARDALIHGRPALKMVGGKVRMRKK